MIVFKLLLFLYFSYNKAYASGQAPSITSASNSSHLLSQVKSIQQSIWDHGIFDVVLEFICYQSPSLDERIPHGDEIDCGPPTHISPREEDFISTITDVVNEVTTSSIACAASLAKSAPAHRCKPLLPTLLRSAVVIPPTYNRIQRIMLNEPFPNNSVYNFRASP
jgi:hypothetical protein